MTKQANNTVEFEHDALVLRTSAHDHTSYRGTFKWPKEVGTLVDCPDWKPTEYCGNGLHGLLDGLGDWSLIPQGPGRVWQVVGVLRDECANLGGDKVKFPRCRLLYVGDMAGAMKLVAPQMCEAIYNSATRNKKKKHTRAVEKPAYSSGNCSAAATTGYKSAAATTGEHSIAAALGPNSRAKAGMGGAITVAAYGNEEWNGKKGRYERPLLAIRSAMVGQDGVEPDVWYELSADGQFVKCEDQTDPA